MTKRGSSRFLNKEVLICDLSSDSPWVGTIVDLFEDGGSWFYAVRSEKRRFSLAVNAVNWIEIRSSKKKKHKRKMGKILQLIKK
jgi:hypothetical protein